MNSIMTHEISFLIVNDFIYDMLVSRSNYPAFSHLVLLDMILQPVIFPPIGNLELDWVVFYLLECWLDPIVL